MRHLVGFITGVWVSKTSHLQNIMNRIAERCEFTVVARAFHQFEPHGATGVLVLAESHFSAHTYPEDNKVYIDVFCCSPNFDPEFCARIIEQEFCADDGVWKVVKR
jgi:S-adenosylmethionine decarboxylase proenzyme